MHIAVDVSIAIPATLPFQSGSFASPASDSFQSGPTFSASLAQASESPDTNAPAVKTRTAEGSSEKPAPRRETAKQDDGSSSTTGSADPADTPSQPFVGVDVQPPVPAVENKQSLSGQAVVGMAASSSQFGTDLSTPLGASNRGAESSPGSTVSAQTTASDRDAVKAAIQPSGQTTATDVVTGVGALSATDVIRPASPSLHPDDARTQAAAAAPSSTGALNDDLTWSIAPALAAFSLSSPTQSAASVLSTSGKDASAQVSRAGSATQRLGGAPRNDKSQAPISLAGRNNSSVLSPSDLPVPAVASAADQDGSSVAVAQQGSAQTEEKDADSVRSGSTTAKGTAGASNDPANLPFGAPASTAGAFQAAEIPASGAASTGDRAVSDSHAPGASATPANSGSTVAAGPGTADGAALPGIQTARVLQGMSQTEMRLGMHSEEFGPISISTSLSHQQLTAQISLEHDALGAALETHMAAIQEKLGAAYGVQARVEVRDTGMQFSSGGNPQQAGGERQQRGGSGQSQPLGSGDSTHLAIPTMPEARSAGYPLLPDASTRLSVRV